jgi:hypothetical protein
MVIFHSYVKIPEGRDIKIIYIFNIRLYTQEKVAHPIY